MRIARGTVDRDGVRLAHVEAGEGGLPMVCVHGWCCDHRHLLPQVEHFCARRRVVSVDLRGHGASDAPEQEYTIDGFADDVGWVCAQLGIERAVVVGHSMGGMVTLALAARAPALVAAVVLLDVPLVLPSDLPPVMAELAAALHGPDGEEIRRTSIGGMFAPTDDPDIQAAVEHTILHTPMHVAASAFTSIAAWDPAQVVGRLQAPLLGVIAADGVLSTSQFPPDAAPHVSVGQVVGSGHFVQLQVPDQVNPMIDRFLTLHAPSLQENRRG